MSLADPPVQRRALLHPGLVASGATLLMAALATDTLYWQSALFQWNNFSSWLLVAGLALAALAAVAFVIDLLFRRVGRVAWLRFAGLALAIAVEVVNALVHSRDAWTAVVPQGLILSAVATLLLLAVGLGGGWSLSAARTGPLHLTGGPRR